MLQVVVATFWRVGMRLGGLDERECERKERKHLIMAVVVMLDANRREDVLIHCCNGTLM